MTMNVVVVGCGRVGADLAYRLFQKGHQVSIIDNVAFSFNNLPSEFRGRTVEGEGLSQDVLHRAGIREADALAAMTDSDPVNAVIGHIARTEYDILQVVVRNIRPEWRVFHEAFGLQVVSPGSWGAQRVEELLSPAAIPVVFSAGNGEVEIYEFGVPEQWAGHRLQEIVPPAGCVAVSLTRAGRAMLPTHDVQLEEGDVLHISATQEGIEALSKRLHLEEKS